MLSDVVRVIRTFQPDVIVTRFSPEASRTHGHHTASAVLSVEAFKLAGDPKAFPEQLKDLEPWQPKRVLMNGGGFGRGGPGGAADNGGVQLDIGGIRSGAERIVRRNCRPQPGDAQIAGLRQFRPRRRARRAHAAESFQLLAGEPAKSDIFDGVDTTWNRIPGGAAIGPAIEKIIAKFNPQDPAASVPDLLALRSQLAALPASRLVDIKRRELDQVLQNCVGLSFETTVANAEVVPGETVALHHAATVRSGVPVKWLGVRYPSISKDASDPIELHANQAAVRESKQTIPADTPLSQPYWLREPSAIGTYHVADPTLIGRPENPPAFPIEQVFEIGGQKLVLADEPVEIIEKTGQANRAAPLGNCRPGGIKFRFRRREFHSRRGAAGASSSDRGASGHQRAVEARCACRLESFARVAIVSD